MRVWLYGRRQVTLRVAPAGLKVIGTAAVVSFALTITGAFAIGEYSLVFLLPLAFAMFFFRDPEREPEDASPSAILAPADGKVVAITAGQMPITNVAAAKIDIFLSVFDVHINRAPAAGKVARRAYAAGAFLNALKAEAGEANESNTVLLEVQGGRHIAVKQIAGVIARRIVCDVKEGDFLFAGQRFGMIMFGSRTQLFIPADAGFEPCVTVGEHVKAGRTVLGHVK
jgi:phosphatidylserine decarboxylase